MTLVAPNVGEQKLLENAVKTATPEALVLRLYSNNYDCINTSIASNFTEVGAGVGYTATTLDRASWGSAVGGSPSSITYGSGILTTFSGVATVVGYFVTGADSGVLYIAERLYAGAGQAFGSGDKLTVTPVLTLASASND